MKFVMDGDAQLELTIEREERVESPAGKSPRHEVTPQKLEEPKPPKEKPKAESPTGTENP